jgi:hypothetical protein
VGARMTNRHAPGARSCSRSSSSSSAKTSDAWTPGTSDRAEKAVSDPYTDRPQGDGSGGPW